MIPPSPPVTLRDVARAAGVSTASASRALARKGTVSADLRQRILAAAERLGYLPNLAARSLAARRSDLIGVLVNTLAEPLIAQVVAALEHRLAEAGYAIAIVATRGSLGDSLAALHGLLGRGVEGFVLAEPAHVRELANALRTRGLPWIGMTAEADGVEFTVADGHRRGAELAARYLLSLGHRHIGVIAPDAATLAGVAAALAGSDASLPAVGTELARDLDAAQSAMRQLLDADDSPTAVVCGSDLHALTAVRTCLGQGVAVPQAVSIVGFGDAEFARRAVPALTTVRIPATRLGFRLAESLLACLEHEGVPLLFDTPVKLVVRESTGPAAR